MYDRILLTTDGSDEALAALPHAFDLTDRYGAELHVLSVADVKPWSKGAERSLVRDEVEDAAADAVDAVADRARARGLSATTAVEIGVPHGAILAYAEDHDVDLIVMGSHGRTGLGHALLGSVAERVVRHAAMPVMTVRLDGDEGAGDG